MFLCHPMTTLNSVGPLEGRHRADASRLPTAARFMRASCDESCNLKVLLGLYTLNMSLI